VLAARAWHDGGMAKRYPDEVKARVLELYQQHGAAEAARLSGVPVGSVKGWAHRAGLRNGGIEQVQAAVAMRVASAAEKRAALADNLLDDAERFRTLAWAPSELIRYDGGEHGRGWVTFVLERPTPSEQLALVKAMNTALNAAQLLAGEATERHAHVAGSAEAILEAELEAELRAYQQGREDARVEAEAEG
jgi:transposase-like protein